MDQNAGNLDLGGGGKEGNLENLAVGGASSVGNASTSKKIEGLVSQDGDGHLLKAIGEPLSQFSNGNSSEFVDKTANGDGTGNNSAGNLKEGDKGPDSGTRRNEFRLAEASVEGKEEGVVGKNMLCGQVEQSISVSLKNNHVNQSAAETVIVINPEESVSISRETRLLKGKGSGSDKAPEEKLVEAGEAGVIDITALTSNRGGLKESWDGEKVCRICHLNSVPSQESANGNFAAAAAGDTDDLIQLGCGCKDELGIAHRHCAEAWFKLKGNRMCEICSEAAKNITGVGDLRFMEGWNEQGFSGSSGGSSERAVACWRGQPFCNFLMACLVISFVLPWFLRVNMF